MEFKRFSGIGNMSCRGTRRNLVATEKGETSRNLANEVSEHLKSCPHCAAENEELKKLDALLGSVEAPAPDPQLWTRIESAMVERGQPRFSAQAGPFAGHGMRGAVRRLPWTRTALFAAAGIVMVLAAYELVNGLKDRVPVSGIEIGALLLDFRSADDASPARIMDSAGGRDLSVGQSVPSDSLIVLPARSTALFDMPSVGLVRLVGPGVFRNGARGITGLESGEVFADIKSGRGQFVVGTPAAAVTVKGTKFLVSFSSAETRIVVAEGVVSVSNGSGKCDVGAGSECRVLAGKPPEAPRPSNAASALDVDIRKMLFVNPSVEVFPAQVKWSGGEDVRISVRITNPDGPMRLLRHGNARVFYSLRVTTPSGETFHVNLNTRNVSEKTSGVSGDEFMSLQRGDVYECVFTLSDVFVDIGRYRISATYAGAPPETGEGAPGLAPWRGIVESEPLIVEIAGK
jgi:hypothetical protein